MTEAPLLPFKILAIDGGGLRGIFPAALLAWLEEYTGACIANHFDLMVGTSTGGILVLGLADGMAAGEIRRFYVEHGPQIFPSAGGRWRRAWRAVRSRLAVRHSAAPLEAALREAFHDHTMGSLRKRVVIPTFDAGAGEIRLIKTAHHARLVRDHSRTLVETALATSAAPTYLPGHVTTRGERLLDGGLWANNPIGVAVVEAVGYLRVPPAAIKVLSIGTTRAPYEYPMNAMRAGLLAFAAGRAKEALLAAQMTGAYSTAKVLLGGDERILRLDPAVRDGRFEMDRPEDIPELIALGERWAMQNCERIRQEFLEAPAAYPGLALD
jgi:patatin-like phospholipase/acyl hydrolase